MPVRIVSKGGLKACAALSAVVLAVQLSPASAEPASQPPAAAADAAAPLPPDVRVKGQVAARGSLIRYTAVAGSLPARDRAGVKCGEITYIAYLAEGAPSIERPVTFVFSGGPTAASMALNLAFGPKALPAGDPSAPAALIDNPDSWLDFTDLVFVDPVGTGWSRSLVDQAESRRQFWGARQDAESMARFAKAWLVKERRMSSPKYLAGTSYGGFRAPKMATVLNGMNVPLDGIVLLSPAIDFTAPRSGFDNPLYTAVVLPSLAAAAIEKRTGRDVEPAELAEVERYATGEYAVDILKGVNDAEAVERMSRKVAQFTGLDLETVRRQGGRLDPGSFSRELFRTEGRFSGTDDVMVTVYDPHPTSVSMQMIPPAASYGEGAFVDYVANVLNWKADAPYVYHNIAVGLQWDWGGEQFGSRELDASVDIRNLLAANPRFKVLIGHGATDLNTAYMTSKLMVAQIPDFGGRKRLEFHLYPGGHGFFVTREASRRALHDDVRALYARKVD